MTGPETVFIVDDDPAIRDSVRLLVESVGLRGRCYESAQAFLDADANHDGGCLIVDIRMPEMSGLQLQERLRGRADALPVIVLTAHGEVPDAVHAMKQGAVDFVQKPFRAQDLLDKIHQALAEARARRAERSQSAEVCARIATLTPREAEVVRLVARGRANKVIAAELGISERTVEIHRGRVMRKMGARSLADLLHLLPSDYAG